MSPDLQARVIHEVSALVEDLLGDDTTVAPWHVLDAIASELHVATYAVIAEARKQGLTVGPRETTKHFRTIHSNSHDRWHGPGSCATHGGSGWQQVAGFAGDEG